jgi:hypothetical protein
MSDRVYRNTQLFNISITNREQGYKKVYTEDTCANTVENEELKVYTPQYMLEVFPSLRGCP